MSESELSPEDELRDEISQADGKADKVIADARERIEEAQKIKDSAKFTITILDIAPNSVNIEAQLSSWQNINDILGIAQGGMADFHNVITSGSGVAGTLTTDLYYRANEFKAYGYPDLEEERISAFDGIVIQVGEYLSQPSNKDEAMNLLYNWGFNIPSAGLKSVVELFEIAHQAYETPLTDSTPASTSLLPMRDCLNQMASELLRRRPNQERTSNNYAKIMSVGSQLKKDEIEVSIVDTWAFQFDRLINELSGSKHKSFSREEWRDLLFQATSFISNLLNGLDISKVRR